MAVFGIPAICVTTDILHNHQTFGWNQQATVTKTSAPWVGSSHGSQLLETRPMNINKIEQDERVRAAPPTIGFKFKFPRSNHHASSTYHFPEKYSLKFSAFFDP